MIHTLFRRASSAVIFGCGVILLLSCVLSPGRRVDKNGKTADTVGIDETSPERGEKNIPSQKAERKKTSSDTQKNDKQPVAPDPLAEYKILVENIKLHAEHSPAPTVNGRPFASEFSASVTDTEGKPLEGITLTVKYPCANENGALSFTTLNIISDENGKAGFASPLPEFSCDADILFYPTPKTTDKEVISYAENHAVKMPYKVHTNKLRRVFSISLIDYTPSDRIITTNSVSSSALLKAMYKKSFRSVGNAEFVKEIDSGNTKLLYKSASALFANKINYLIFGTVKYEQPVEKDAEGLYTAVLKADISIMEMQSGDIVLHKLESFSAQEKSEWQLLDTLRNKMMAPFLADFIYYNL